MYIYTYIFEETVVRKLSALMKSIYTAMEEIQQTQALKETRTTSNHIIIRLFKIKDKKKILKEARKRERERDVTHKGAKIGVTEDFLQRKCKQKDSGSLKHWEKTAHLYPICNNIFQK